MPATLLAASICLQYRFEVPSGLPESEEHGDNEYLWRLDLHGDMPGVDQSRSFEIPFIGCPDRAMRLIQVIQFAVRQFDGHSLTAVRRILGIPVSNKAAVYPLIRAIEIKHNGNSQSGNSHCINYQVIAKTASDDIALAEGLDAHSKATRVVEYFEVLTGNRGQSGHLHLDGDQPRP